MAGTSNAYAQRVAQMEQDSFDDAWTKAMVADSLAQSYNHLWLAEDDAGTPCGYLLANVLVTRRNCCVLRSTRNAGKMGLDSY